MPHLAPLADDQAGEPARALLLQLRNKLGTVPKMYRTLAHAPQVLDAAIVMGRAIRTDLDAKLRELVYLRVAQICACDVCLHYHDAAGRKAGLTETQIRDLRRFEDSTAFSEIEKDVLRFAEQWTGPGRVLDDVLERLKRTLSPADLVLLAATAAQANFTSRFNVVFGVELP